MTRSDAERKVRALRATAAPGSGATDPERDTARRLADRLSAEHGLAGPSRRAGGGAVTVDVAEFTFRPQDVADAMAMLRDRALNDKRKAFRDILNGTRS